MNDILVPCDPADLIDRIIDLQLRIESAPDSPQRSDMVRQRELLSRLAARVMPQDDRMTTLTRDLFAARSDLFSLIRDLQDCDQRKEYDTGFVALTQAMLAALAAAKTARDAINCHAAAHSPTMKHGVVAWTPVHWYLLRSVFLMML
jgi:hypothetical protein